MSKAKPDPSAKNGSAPSLGVLACELRLAGDDPAKVSALLRRLPEAAALPPGVFGLVLEEVRNAARANAEQSDAVAVVAIHQRLKGWFDPQKENKEERGLGSLADKLPSFQRLYHEAMKQKNDRLALARMLAEWAGNYGMLPDRTPKELAEELRGAGYENHGLTELLARYTEALAKSETTSSESAAEGIALLLFAQQERLALRIEEAANTLYRVHKEQQKPQE